MVKDGSGYQDMTTCHCANIGPARDYVQSWPVWGRLLPVMNPDRR
jgi:hypothetical protein